MLLEDYMSESTLTQLPRKYYNEQAGLEYIGVLAVSSEVPGLRLAVEKRFYAVSAAAAVLRHVEGVYARFAAGTLRVRYEPCEGSMVIDFTTVRSLELVQNLQNQKSSACLLGLLNGTQTAMGVRLLRTNVLQPLTERTTIESRLDAVEELTGKEAMFFAVQEALKGFPDMDRLCTAVTSPGCSLRLTRRAMFTRGLMKTVDYNPGQGELEALGAKHQQCHSPQTGGRACWTSF